MEHALLAPLSLGARTVAPNRIWLAPLTNLQSQPDGALSDDELRWLEARAAGGFGVIESCATWVSPEGRGWVGQLGIDRDARVADWRRLAEGMHTHGALLVPQLFHGGVRSIGVPGGPRRWSSNAALETARTPSGSQPDPADDAVAEGSESEIAGAVASFAAAARRAELAGADGVELHGAHGYLLCQFLSATHNRRTDRWGGSLEGRARLLRETARAVRAATGEGFVVGVRLSPESYPGFDGLDLDESVQVARWLAEDGCDFVHLSLWNASKNTAKHPDRHAIPLFRAALPERVRIVAAGAIWTREDALHALELGADAVALGRAAIANPDWPRTVAATGAEPRRPPLSAEELAARALSPSFVEYMRRWSGFVAD